MTGVLWFLVAAALITLAGVLWLEHRHRLRVADEAEYEDELNDQFGGSHDETTATETLLPLPAEDLVGADDRDRPGPVGSVGIAWDEPAAQSADPPDDPGSQNVPAVDPGRSVAVADAPLGRVSLTPAQRRRAVKKGRIPRDLPSPDRAGQINLLSPSTAEPYAASPSGGRAGEFHCCDDVPPGVNHSHVHRLDCLRPDCHGCAEQRERIPLPLEVYDPLMRAWMPVFPTLLESARHEAHFRQWETELGSLIDGAYAWLETAA